MPLQIGYNSSEGWRGVQDIRVDGAAVQFVAMPVGKTWLELWRRKPYVVEITSDTTLLTPSWALYADIVMIGGGGGGAGGNGAVSNHGRGGKSGDWRAATRLVQPGQEIEFTIGLGGAGSKTEKGPGSIGGTTIFVHTNYSARAIGGEGGVGGGGCASVIGDDAGSDTHGEWHGPGGAAGAGER